MCVWGRPAVASLNIRGKWAWLYDEGRFLLSVCVYSLAFRSFGREGGREGVALRLGNVTPESNPSNRRDLRVSSPRHASPANPPAVLLNLKLTG